MERALSGETDLVIMSLRSGAGLDGLQSRFGHADRAWALFLAIAAASRGLQPPAGESIEADEEAYRPAAMPKRRRVQLHGRRGIAALLHRRQA